MTLHDILKCETEAPIMTDNMLYDTMYTIIHAAQSHTRKMNLEARGVMM